MKIKILYSVMYQLKFTDNKFKIKTTDILYDEINKKFIVKMMD